MSVSQKNSGHLPVNRGQMRKKRTLAQCLTVVRLSDFPEQHPEPDMRVAINFTAPMHPGAFAHILNVVREHGVTKLRVCLENHKHIRFTLPLHDCRLTQHHA